MSFGYNVLKWDDELKLDGTGHSHPGNSDGLKQALPDQLELVPAREPLKILTVEKARQ